MGKKSRVRRAKYEQRVAESEIAEVMKAGSFHARAYNTSFKNEDFDSYMLRGEFPPEIQGMIYEQLDIDNFDIAICGNNVWSSICDTDVTRLRDLIGTESVKDWGLFNVTPPFESTFIEFSNVKPWWNGDVTLPCNIGVRFSYSDDDVLNIRVSIIWQVKDRAIKKLSYYLMQLDDNGTIVGFLDPDDPGQKGRSLNILYPALLTLQFLNCKNVELVDYEPSLRIKQLSEKHHVPLDTYKVLKVNTTRKVYPDREGDDSPSDPKRLHIVRGHFAHYTDDAPLFGKYTGTFWIPAHVRGDESLGVVVKDYEIGE
ncbi:MAG: hypothetical protein K8L99_02455 [Anaerolineae bacterium]|nr:hypothetical protein [Anaerolineae bacterium]